MNRIITLLSIIELKLYLAQQQSLLIFKQKGIHNLEIAKIRKIKEMGWN